jgi:hypothetical protein
MERGSEKRRDTFLSLVSVFIFISHTILSCFLASPYTGYSILHCFQYLTLGAEPAQGCSLRRNVVKVKVTL